MDQADVSEGDDDDDESEDGSNVSNLIAEDSDEDYDAGMYRRIDNSFQRQLDLSNAFAAAQRYQQYRDTYEDVQVEQDNASEQDNANEDDSEDFIRPRKRKNILQISSEMEEDSDVDEYVNDSFCVSDSEPILRVREPSNKRRRVRNFNDNDSL